MPATTATPQPSVQLPALPQILKDPKLIQLILAKLAAETARADAETKDKEEAKASREEWKAIADKEKARGDALAIADANRIEESASLRASVGFLRESVTEYKDKVKDLEAENKSLRSSRKWYAVGGAAVGTAFGIATCKATTKLGL